MPNSQNLLLAVLPCMMLACASTRTAEPEAVSRALDLPLANAPEIAARQSSIRAEIACLDRRRAWAGVYCWQGSGGLFELAGTCTLELAPDAGFVMLGHLEAGSMVDESGAPFPSETIDTWHYGSVREESGCVQLQFETPNENFGVKFLPEQYRVVRWSDRAYLVPEVQLLRFANATNQGLEPRTTPAGLFPLRRGDEGKPAMGRPDLPPEHAIHLLAEPILAHVINLEFVSFHSTNKWMHMHNPLHLDVGFADGAFEGMELIFVEPPDSGWVILSKVSERESEGDYGYYGDGTPSPRSGWTCSSRKP
jgi:hypothetical protein